MTEEYMIRIPAKTEGMALILAFVSYLLDVTAVPANPAHS